MRSRQRGGDCRHSRAVLAYSIGNEIPAGHRPLARGAARRAVSAELADVARQADPERSCHLRQLPAHGVSRPLVPRFRHVQRLSARPGNLPPLPVCGCRTWSATSRWCWARLGMDTLRHGETGAGRVPGRPRPRGDADGAGGAFVFSWTDEWFTGGQAIVDWAFGLTDGRPQPKTSYHALRETVAARRPSRSAAQAAERLGRRLLAITAASTLDQCLGIACACSIIPTTK